MLAYTVVEALCRAKGTPAQNEDRLVIRPYVVAVVDGSTSSPPVGGVAAPPGRGTLPSLRHGGRTG